MMRKRYMAALTAGAVILLVGGTAAASVPDSAGVIHACRKNTDGSLRAIDTAVTTTCPSGYTALNWSQTGPAGPTGPAGITNVAIAENYYPMTPNYDYGQGFAVSNSVLCPSGKVALGGGAYAPVESDGSAMTWWTLVRSAPLQDGTNAVGWQAAAIRSTPGWTSANPGTLWTYAICANVGS